MEIKQVKIEKGTAHIKIDVTPEEVSLEQEKVVDEMIKNVSVKGFRHGKAPRTIAKNYLDPNKLTDHVLNHILSHAIQEAVRQNHYRLLGRPVLEDLKTNKSNGWSINLQLPLYPEIKLGKYSQYLKTKKIKGKNDRQVEDIYQSLLEHETVEISDLVITEEVNHSLERLKDQAKSLNLSVEGYLKAIKKDLESVSKDYAENANKSIKLDLILLEIAKQEKIDTEDHELQEFAKVSNITSANLDQLRSIMNRRKTIDYLLSI